MILIIFYIFSISCTCICLHNKDLITETSLGDISPLSIGLKFITAVNNTSDLDYFVEARPDECCLVSDVDIDCESMIIIGECLAAVPKGTTKSLSLIAPLIDPFERHGYCTFYLDSHPRDRKINVMRDEIKVKFDTRLKNKSQVIDVYKTVQPCQNLDEDPINGCNPVNCDIHYNGVKYFYSAKEKRCIEAPKCVGSEVDGQDVIYNHVTNKCVRQASVSDEDMEYIKSLTNKDRHAKDILIIKSVEPKGFIDNNETAYPFYKNTMEILQKTVTHKHHNTGTFKTVVTYLKANKYVLIVLGLVILVQCCLICTMVYCLSKGCTCCKKKKVESKYFNYRQDASVTTPLIYTSNNHTDTTDFQFTSDSSNVDKKIKCYKACQREKASNVKMSLSDDILSKCLNRRKWDRISKSDAIKEDIEAGREKIENVANKVTFNDSNHKNIDVVIDKDENDSREKEDGYDINNDISEKEIKCHTYNCYDDGANIANLKTASNDINEKNIKNTSSNSTEKGAQASFSNDSIDDFLSDRGIMFLAEGNLSNSLLNSSEAVTSTISSVSSKTSKNNVVKNVLSLLSRRTKPSSVPGTKKSKENLDLELIHMSRATVFSSSSRSDHALKRIKDSKSSL